MALFNQKTGIFSSSAKPVTLPLHPHMDFVTHMFESRSFGLIDPAKVALIDGETGESLTRAQIRAAIESLAIRMESMIKQGDVVMILLPNSLHFAVIFNATIKLGGVATTINVDPNVSTPQDIHKQIASSQSKIVFTIKSVSERVGEFSVPVVLVDEEEGAFENDPILFPKKITANGNSSSSSSLRRVKQSDPAALLYSSGTTGVSKGVITSQGNLIAACEITENSPDGMDDPEEVILCLFPMCSMGGLVWLACASLMGGPKIVFVPKYDISRVLAAIDKHKINKITCAPPFALDLLNTSVSERSKYDLSSFRTLLCAGAPLSKDTMEAVLANFPHITKYYQLYGMTETTTLGSGGAGPLGSVGSLCACMEAKVVDLDSGKSLGPNQRGELMMRGPSVMQGYLNNAVATAEAIEPRGGWIRTGDAVHFDDQGYLYIVERLKEYIKYKGSQVAPAELEAILLAHPDIADCAVIPFPDAAAGEIPLACVVRGSGKQLTDQEVMDYVSSQVSALKNVRKVVFLDSIPKSATGKILRKELKLRFNKMS